MKKAFIIFFIAALVTAGYFYLQHYFDKQETDVWELVPGNALAVYETDIPVKVWNEFLTLPVWENLSSIPEFNSVNEKLIELDSVTGGKGEIERLLRDENLLISIHKISNTALDAILYVTINTGEKKRIINTITDHYNNQPGLDHQIRNYEDFNIHEMISHEGTAFTFLEYKEFFIGSSTPFLVDDVIRNISRDFKKNFRTEMAEIFQAKPIETDQGNLYIDMTKIPDLIRNYIRPVEMNENSNIIHHLAKAMYYDLSFEGNRIFLNGSVLQPAGGDRYYLSTFYDQDPQSIETVEYLPSMTASYLNFTFDDFISWRQAVDRYWEVHHPENLRNKINFFQENNTYEKDFYLWVGNEIGVATLQSINIDEPDKLILIKADKMNEGLNVLDELTLHVNHQNNDTLLYENYSGITIKRLNIEEFPATIMGEEFSGFESSYYAPVKDLIVIGNSFDVIKMLLNDIENDNTWGKSLNFVQYFENIQRKANLSYFVNFNHAWNTFYSRLNDTWKEFFNQYDHQFKHFDYISFQFSNINDNFYTSAALQHRPRTSTIQTPASFLIEQMAVTDHPVVTRPFVVRSHLDRSLETVVQDSADYLYLIGSEGNILWQDSVGERIRGELYQVDFYNNKKLQYFFATRQGLYIIDRNGEYITDFPVYFEEPIEVEWVNVIDYDNSKRYRYLIADTDGRLYLFDKYGVLLEGWDPKELSGSLSTVPFHIRINGRDCMVAIEENGMVNMFHRRGNPYEGFPVNFEFQIKGPVFVQKGNGFEKSMIHTILQTGEINKINLKGEIVSRNQLYRPGKESYFEIIPDVLGKTYVITRQDFNNFSIITPDGKEIFEEELLFSDHLSVQYYNFSAGNQIFALTDKQQGFTYLYDGNGNLINQQPVESGFEIGLIYSEVNNNYKLYTCYGNQFTISSFYRR